MFGYNGKDFQRGDEIDVLFDQNENTEAFFENDEFPKLLRRKDLRLFGVGFEDFVDNAKWGGDYNPDEFWTVALKNGTVYEVDSLAPNEVYRKIKKDAIKTGNVLWVLQDGGWGSEFWFNGWEGLLSLQQYTGWFDMSLYDDSWI